MKCAFVPPVAALGALVLAVPARGQTPVFADLHAMLPADRDPTAAVAVGDVDADGDLDLFLGNGDGFNGAGEQNRLYLNDGVGVYADATDRLPTASDPTNAAAFGDVNGNGTLDVLIANSGQNRLYLNDGSGTFSDATSMLPVGGGNTLDVDLGDIDGDGDLDALLGNFFFGSNQLYVNDGAGGFTDASSQLPADADATLAVALGDIDGDGDLDAFIGNGFEDIGVPDRLYLNGGAGIFVDGSSQLPSDLEDTRDVVFLDVDGDTDLDAFLAKGFVGPFGEGGPGQSRLFLNDGSGLFSDATVQLPVGLSDSRSVAVGDVDGDLDLDVLLAIEFGNNQLFLNDGAGTFSDSSGLLPPDPGTTLAVALVDVDGDLDLDAVIGNGKGESNQLHLNDGTGRFVDVTDSFPRDGDDTTALVLADLDGDGLLDALAVNQNQPNRLYLNDGSGPFVDASSQLPVDMRRTSSVALGDLDGDGDLDAVLGNSVGQTNQLYRNLGGAVFTDASFLLPPFTDTTNAVALGDVDGDGDLDVFFANTAGEENRVLLNTGAGSFNGPTGLLPGDTDPTTSVALGDLDGDGDVDALVGNSSLTAPNRVYLNNGIAAFAEAVGALPPHFDATTDVALGDVDGDGDLDVYVGNGVFPPQFSGQNDLYLNDGSGTFSNATSGIPNPIEDDTRSVFLGDVDEDGDLDVLVGNGGEANRLALNDGAGGFSAAAFPALADATSDAALGDLDGDGDVDAFVANVRQQNHYYPNLIRHLARSSVPRIGKPITMDVYGQPGGVFLLAIAAGTAQIPLPFGILRLDPLSLNILATGVLDGDGFAAAPFVVPNDVTLVGVDRFWQAAVGVPFTFTNLDITTFTDL